MWKRHGETRRNQKGQKVFVKLGWICICGEKLIRNGVEPPYYAWVDYVMFRLKKVGMKV